MGLKHVTQPTHEVGHTLDLLISREYDPVIRNVAVVHRYLSDHAGVLCHLNSAKPRVAVKNISHRKLKSIDIDALDDDLKDSDLCSK